MMMMMIRLSEDTMYSGRLYLFTSLPHFVADSLLSKMFPLLTPLLMVKSEPVQANEPPAPFPRYTFLQKRCVFQSPP